MPVFKLPGSAIQANTVTANQIASTITNQANNAYAAANLAYAQANAAYNQANTGSGGVSLGLVIALS